MKAPRLRTQLVLVLVLLQLYAALAASAYWLLSRAHRRLEASFHSDLAVLASLPQLRQALAGLERSTDRYLLTGAPAALSERGRRAAEAASLLSDLKALLPEGEEQRLLASAERRLARYRAEREYWVARKRSGGLSSGEALRLAALPGIEAEIETQLGDLRRVNLEALESRRRGVESAGRRILVLVVVAGLATGLVVFLLLSRLIVGPVSRLQRYAAAWALGKPWAMRPSGGSPEVDELVEAVGQMATRLNEQYEKEQELGRFKTRLVAMVSHEFNNALSVIGGVTLLLRESDTAKNDPKRARHFEILETHLKALALAANNLLEMGRRESGKLAVKPRRCELRPMLQETLKRMEPLAQRQGLTLSLSAPEEPVWVLADPEALSLVATNLVGNAIKYTRSGSVTAGVEPVPTGARLFVADTGIGIAPQDREKILEGFYRTEEGRKTAKGFGLGLALAASIIEAHGARLEVDSELGKGSRFWVLLPPAPAEDPSAGP